MSLFVKPLADLAEARIKELNLLQEDAGEASLEERVEGPILCGWCRRRYAKRPPSPNCISCGGLLPMPPGMDPGPPPPRPPRELPREFLFRLYVKRNLFQFLLGIALVLGAVPLFLSQAGRPFGPLLLLVGAYIAYSHVTHPHGVHTALARGVHVPGRIEAVHRFGEEEEHAADGRESTSTMYRIYFRFDVDGEPLMGLQYTHDPAITKHFAGEPIWVVYGPRRVKHYAIWPPLA